MPTVKTYVQKLRRLHRYAAKASDVDLSKSDKQTRALVTSVLTPLAVLVRVLIEDGVLTEERLEQALEQEATSTDYEPEPLDPGGP